MVCKAVSAQRAVRLTGNLSDTLLPLYGATLLMSSYQAMPRIRRSLRTWEVCTALLCQFCWDHPAVHVSAPYRRTVSVCRRRWSDCVFPGLDWRAPTSRLEVDRIPHASIRYARTPGRPSPAASQHRTFYKTVDPLSWLAVVEWPPAMMIMIHYNRCYNRS